MTPFALWENDSEASILKLSQIIFINAICGQERVHYYNINPLFFPLAVSFNHTSGKKSFFHFHYLKKFR